MHKYHKELKTCIQIIFYIKYYTKKCLLTSALSFLWYLIYLSINILTKLNWVQPFTFYLCNTLEMERKSCYCWLMLKKWNGVLLKYIYIIFLQSSEDILAKLLSTACKSYIFFRYRYLILEVLLDTKKTFIWGSVEVNLQIFMKTFWFMLLQILLKYFQLYLNGLY